MRAHACVYIDRPSRTHPRGDRPSRIRRHVCVCVGSLRHAMREKKMGGCIVGACHHGV